MLEREYSITPETRIFIRGIEVPKDRKDLEEQFKDISGTIILNEVVE